MTATAGRREHYRRFYAADPPPGGELLMVLGNCQAESVRLLLDPDEVRSVRVPPVFELERDDLPALLSLVGRATALVTQPVRADYRDLPLGTDQLAGALGPNGRLVRFPIVRYAGLQPCHVVVHSTHDGAGPVPLPQPPVVAYHDLRTVAAALGVPVGRPQPDGVRAVADASLAELRRRETLTDVTISPVLAVPTREHMRTVNHPGNPVLLGLAAGVSRVLGLQAPRDPGRALLDSIQAPVESAAASAWGLVLDPGPPTWRLDGRSVHDAEIARRHLEWYAEHPAVAAAVWQRHERTAELLGLV